MLLQNSYCPCYKEVRMLNDKKSFINPGTPKGALTKDLSKLPGKIEKFR